jgi:hypothetical protein
VFAGLLSIGLAVFFGIAQSWGEAFVISADIIFMLLSGSCTILAIAVVRRWGRKGRFGRVCFGIFVGMFFIFLGDLAGGVYDIILQVVTPFPSYADLLYLLGYAIAIVSVLSFLWFFGRTIERKTVYKVVLLFAITAAVLSIVFLVSHTLTGTAIVDLDVAYLCLDTFAIMLSVMMLQFFRSKFISPPWRWFALGLLLIGIAHFLNSLGNTEGWYTYPQPLDLIYLWGYVSFGLGFSIQASSEAFESDQKLPMPLAS